MKTHLHRRLALALAPLVLATNFCVGQTKSTSPPQSSSWPGKHYLVPGEKLHIVTVSSPIHRQNCTVAAFDATQLACKRSFGRLPRVFQPDDVLALIRPAGRDPAATPTLVVLGLEAAVVAGSVLLWPVSVAGGIALVTTGSFVNLFALLGIAMGANDSPQPELLYLRPGSTLQTAVR